jgi:hypothetical protein
MFQAKVIQVDCIFIGAAIPATSGFRFRAAHPQVDDRDGFSWTSVEELRLATSTLFRAGRLRRVTADPSVVPDNFAAWHSVSHAEPPHRPSPAAPWSAR